MKKNGIFIILTVSAALFLFVSAGRAEINPKPTAINVSYVTSPFNLPIIIMKEQGLLEQEFEDDEITINWHEITSGARQAEAMAAGSLDIASVINSTSVVLANAAGNQVLIASGFSRPQKTFGIMTGPNGPQTIAELRGAKVAGPKGTVLHQILIAALASEGLTESDIEFFSMGLPQSRAALLDGQVDAALQAASLIIRNKEAGCRLLATAEGYAIPKLVVGVRPEFWNEYPELISRYISVQEKAMDYIELNTEEALAIGAAEHEISMDDARMLYDWSDFTLSLSPEDVASMNDDIRFLLRQGMIEREVNPDDFILPSALGR